MGRPRPWIKVIRRFHSALTGLPGAQAAEKLLVPDNIIRNIVVTVDNLSKKKVAADKRPLKATSGQFITHGTGDQLPSVRTTMPATSPSSMW